MNRTLGGSPNGPPQRSSKPPAKFRISDSLSSVFQKTGQTLSPRDGDGDIPSSEEWLSQQRRLDGTSLADVTQSKLSCVPFLLYARTAATPPTFQADQRNATSRHPVDKRVEFHQTMSPDHRTPPIAERF